MQTALFQTKEQELWEALPSLFSSVDVRTIGLGIYYTRADRTVREWAEIGRLKRLSNDEIVFRGLRKSGQAPLAWYEKK
jgi:hypothetical protein